MESGQGHGHPVMPKGQDRDPVPLQANELRIAKLDPQITLKNQCLTCERDLERCILYIRHASESLDRSLAGQLKSMRKQLEEVRFRLAIWISDCSVLQGDYLDLSLDIDKLIRTAFVALHGELCNVSEEISRLFDTSPKLSVDQDIDGRYDVDFGNNHLTQLHRSVFAVINHMHFLAKTQTSIYNAQAILFNIGPQAPLSSQISKLAEVYDSLENESSTAESVASIADEDDLRRAGDERCNQCTQWFRFGTLEFHQQFCQLPESQSIQPMNIFQNPLSGNEARDNFTDTREFEREAETPVFEATEGNLRRKRTRETRDLEEAILETEPTVKPTSKGQPDQAGRSKNVQGKSLVEDHSVRVSSVRGIIEGGPDSKKLRRSSRLSSLKPAPQDPTYQQHPSPLTYHESTPSQSNVYKEATPAEDRPSQIPHHASEGQLARNSEFGSQPQDTQAFSQHIHTKSALSEDVDDEIKEGVWGYLLPLDAEHGRPLVLRKRDPYPTPDGKGGFYRYSSSLEAPHSIGISKSIEVYQEKLFRDATSENFSGGYLIGRHPECDIIIEDPLVSNRHCLIFTETKGSDTDATIEDLSSNGTFINETLIGRNKRRQIKDQDEIAIVNKARFIFRYPKSRGTSSFAQQYTLLEKLGKGHFAEVFLCVEKATGQRYAAKVFTRQPGVKGHLEAEGFKQEMAVLIGVSHPNVLHLKDAFDESNAVYLVLELATEGELFNWIVMKQKLTEAETLHVFIQAFQGVKYLHDRNIVHRDIKPENILLTDKNLSIKLADFGLAIIIGEESFTTTLCGTPSYVAPEILEDKQHRKYTKAVDIWSLGVVLYICLCGFPPFSDELYSRENPYTLSQQIKMGRFDYPSPYWDSVSDSALDLIDHMLTVNVKERYTIDDCLKHPWTTQDTIDTNDSTGGIVGGLANLGFSKRKATRERTMLSSINDVKAKHAIEAQPNKTTFKIHGKPLVGQNENTKPIAMASRVAAKGKHSEDSGSLSNRGKRK